MNAFTLEHVETVGGARHHSAPWVYEDPLDPDEGTDLPVATTRRGLTRLALVAAEVGSRFQREGTSHDPVAWMLAPRRLFDGATAVEAALDREHCLRAVMLHGLSVGLDADPRAIDALMADDHGDGPGGGWDGPGWGGGRPDPESSRLFRVRRLRLFSTVMVLARGGELVHLFHASVAPSVGVVRERIRSRFGSAAADQAEIRLGVDLECETTAGLLPPAFRAMIVSGRRIRWSSMPSLDVTVEHRIPC